LICTAGEARLEETPSGRLVIDASSPTSPGELSDILHPFLHPQLPDARSISLALSGGLDSRTLLALLMRDARQFGVHIFGDDADPDAEIATRIARDVGLREKRFPTRLDAHDWAVASLIEYSAHANATAPASTVARLCAYPQLYADGLVSIDGFFGEIARRSYHKRVAAMGPSAMDARAAELLRFLSSPRPAIFNGDTMNRMREGFREDVEGMIAEFRSVAGRRLEDFLDLAAVRFRLPNFAGYEQARLDGQAVTYMPFAQPSALRGLLRLPLRDRRGDRAFRQAIRRYAPRLTAYPLVKGGVTYPFHLGPSLAWLWTAARRRLGNYYRDPAPAAYLRSIETFVRDTIRSHEVRTYSAYDYDAIQHAVESFYAGDDAFTGFVDWWLAFEMWRAGLSGR